MSVETTDFITLTVLLAPWVLFLGWEVFVLIRRGQRVRVKTISMQARDHGYKLASLVFLWSGCAFHWWFPGPTPSVAGGVAFWLLALALLIEDVILWRRPVETWPRGLKWQRFPPLVALAGGLAAYFLFPQTGPVPWR